MLNTIASVRDIYAIVTLGFPRYIWLFVLLHMFSCVCRVVFVQHIKVVSYNSGRTLVIFYSIV